MNQPINPSPPENGPRPWQPRFGIGAMFLAMVVICAMAAAASYLARALRSGDRGSQLVFILFTLATPMLLMIAVGVIRAVMQWLEQRSK